MELSLIHRVSCRALYHYQLSSQNICKPFLTNTHKMNKKTASKKYSHLRC